MGEATQVAVVPRGHSPGADYLQLTVDLVTAYVSNKDNGIGPDRLPDLIRQVHTSLKALQSTGAEGPRPPEPAVPIRSSVRNEYIVCLEDGRKLKMLRRHLAAKFGMTPDEYRRKWGLPEDYPMTAPAYAARRSQIARDTGLGRRNSDRNR